MSKKKQKNKHKLDIQNAHGQIELNPEELTAELKEKIINECKEVAKGTKASIYELLEMTKELMALEFPEENEEPLDEESF